MSWGAGATIAVLGVLALGCSGPSERSAALAGATLAEPAPAPARAAAPMADPVATTAGIGAPGSSLPSTTTTAALRASAPRPTPTSAPRAQPAPPPPSDPHVCTGSGRDRRTDPPEAVRVTVTAEPTTASNGEVVTLTVTARNTGASPVEHTFTDPTTVDVGTQGRVIWRHGWGSAVPQVVLTERFGPLEEKRETFTWKVGTVCDARSDRYAMTTAALAPGPYTVTGEWRNTGGGWRAEPTTLTIRP